MSRTPQVMLKFYSFSFAVDVNKALQVDIIFYNNNDHCLSPGIVLVEKTIGDILRTSNPKSALFLHLLGSSLPVFPSIPDLVPWKPQFLQCPTTGETAPGGFFPRAFDAGSSDGFTGSP